MFIKAELYIKDGLLFLVFTLNFKQGADDEDLFW